MCLHAKFWVKFFAAFPKGRVSNQRAHLESFLAVSVAGRGQWQFSMMLSNRDKIHQCLNSDILEIDCQFLSAKFS